MAYETVKLTHEQEDVIATYCAKNNITITLGNAYDVTLQAFEKAPVLYIEFDKITGEEEKVDVSQKIARLVECNTKAIERISARAELQKINLNTIQIAKNIEKAKIDSNPDIEKLVDNLNRLNIVDIHSYLALVCFLMQLKYSRDNEILTNDKTCVFFNGVARNGKSVTARAICKVESQYGSVFEAQSGKLLESTHEEQVWKSHVNFFDEVKPTDIDRNSLLTIINGGNAEVNPKNKKQYNYHVNTNNIFTSNDMINLKQRRVSVIKFGNRFNGRPLSEGTMFDIITNIMNSLPNFDHYYDLYNIVSTYNENRINPLALSNIITFMTSKIGYVNYSDNSHSTASLNFAAHEIYLCVQGTFSKQMIPSERKEAIRTALDYLLEKNLLSVVNYKDCSTKHYNVTGDNYIKIMEIYNNINTKDEQNIKASKGELYSALAPYFDNALAPEDRKSEYKEINTSWMKVMLEDDSLGPKEHNIVVAADTEKKGNICLNIFLKKIQRYIDEDPTFEMTYTKGFFIDSVLERYMTKSLCENVSYLFLSRLLKAKAKYLFGKKQDKLIKNLYMRILGITDEKMLNLADRYKLSYIKNCPDGVIIDHEDKSEKSKNKEEDSVSDDEFIDMPF